MFTLIFYLHNKKMVFFKPTAVRTIYAKYSKSSQLYKISHYSLKIRVNIIQNYYFCSAQKKKSKSCKFETIRSWVNDRIFNSLPQFKVIVRPGLANREHREDSRWAGLFLGQEGLCCHATGLNYAVPRLPALIAAPLFLFIIFSQPILLFSPDHISNKFSIDN